jgi:glycosyltransferase involved in cell wall biosynthesis
MDNPSSPGPPRVLLILENNPLAKDGRVRKQAGALAEAGVDVTIVCQHGPDGRRAPVLPGVSVHEYRPPPQPGGKLGFFWEYGYSAAMAAAAIVRVLCQGGIDVIQACQPPDIYFLLAGPLKLFGTRFIVDQRDPSPELYAARYGERRDMFYRLLCTAERLSYRVADHVVCVNGTMLDNARARGGRAVTVVGNGPVLADIMAGTARPELKAGAPFLGCYVGEMGRQDRVDLSLLAIDRLVHGFGRRDCRFVFIGEGECWAELRALADELGLGQWVAFTGWLDPPLLYDYLATADIGLDSGLQDIVTPVKALEYMAVGLPFVAFDLEETRRLAEDACAYAPPGDVDALARCIGDLLDDPARRRTLGAAGRRRVADRYAWERQRDIYVDVILHAPRRQPPTRRSRRADWQRPARFAASVRKEGVCSGQVEPTADDEPT